MKRALTFFALLSLVLGFIISEGTLAQGNKGKGNGSGIKGRTNFVDANKDGKCDNFVDANGDGINDNCTGSAKGKCTENCKGSNYVDANGDGINDNCTGSAKGKCAGNCKGSNFVDANGDGINDNCTGSAKGKCAGNCKGSNFVDANGDGKCDNFVDKDGDGKCDKASASCNNKIIGNKGCDKHSSSSKGCHKGNNTTVNKTDNVTVGEPYPNPFKSSSTLKYELKTAGLVNVSVYDVAGNMIKNIFDGQLGTGEYTAVFNPEGIQAGQYYFVLKFNDVTISRQAAYFK